MAGASPYICQFCPQYRKTIAGMKCDVSGKKVVAIERIMAGSGNMAYEVAGRTLYTVTDMEVPSECPLILEQVIGGQE